MPIDPFDWVYDQPYLSVWDMMARGKPGPGPDFVRHADSETGLTNLKLRLKLKDYEDKVERDQLLEKVADKTGEFNDFVDYEYLRALYDPRYTLNILHRGITYPDVPFMRGGLWGTDCFGPNEFARSDVFLLGKHPGQTEINRGRNFVGPTSQDLIRACKHCGIPEEVFAAWYVTNLVKFDRPGGGTGELAKSWIADCLPILWQELIWVRPRYILCLGSEAIKSLMGTGHNVSNTAGRMLPFTYKAAPRDREVRSCADLEEHTATVVCIPHPSYIYHKPAAYDELQLGLGRFWDLVRGRVDVDVREEAGIRHMAVYSEPILARVVDKIRARPGDLTIAFDAEWHGQHWNDETSYLRTIQFSPAWRESYCVVLNDVGGTEIFRPGAAAAIAQLRRLVADKPDGTVRVGGHAFRADMPWLIAEGLDLRSFFDIPEDHDPRVMPRGFDTLYLAHAAHESTESFKLENLAMRYTSCPRWDVRLQDWKDRYCKEHGLKDRDLEGYGMCPEAILAPYACLHGDSLVQLADGSWEKISTLVYVQYAGLVRAFHDGEVIDAQVTNWHRNDVGQEDWRKLLTAGALGRWGLLGPTFTPDHEIITQRGKVKVEDLVPGEDAILTEEREFSRSQLSVFLGSLLGDGGYLRKNGAGVGFGFSQRPIVGAYADWKAQVFDTHAAKLQPRVSGYRRYHLPFSRYMTSLSRRFPTKPVSEHGKRKAMITTDLLANLHDLGLAVWYQDDGSLVRDNRDGRKTSRIYARISRDEADLVVAWMIARFGDGVSYNAKGGFVRISRGAFVEFHRAIDAYIHPVMAYKAVNPSGLMLHYDKYGEPHYDPIVAVVPHVPPPGRRGHGVRYCLTVAEAGNFLTKAGFVSNCYDADATRRLTDVFWGHCVEDSFRRDPITGRGLDSRVAYLNSMQAWLGFLEMEMIGIEVDVPRAESLIKLFNSKAIQLVDHLRDVLGWPSFNPRSSPMCRELLFGQLLNGTVDKTTGQPRRLRPEGCDRAEVATPEGIKAYPIPLGLTPIKTTGKPPKPWERVVADDEVQKHSASTDKETLGILGHDNDVVRLLRDIRFLAQVGTMVLRPPKSPAAPVSAKGKAGKVGGRAEKAQLDALIAAHQVETSDVRAGRAVDIEPVAGPGPVEVALGHDDEWGEDAEYDGGFLYYLDRDGRVRSHFYAAETGRCTSARPNLQNLAKQRDADYQRILGYYDSKKHREVAPYKDVFGGLCYQYAIRTICRASPGCVLLEWDLMSAEIAMLAWEADDAVMIDDVRRAMLPEGHPEHIDLHAATAVSAFHLDCPPTKKGLDSIGMLHIRTPAKNVRFGVPYGRSADAIARQCREQGAPVSRRDAQTLIDGWHARYRDGSRFLVNCGNRVMDPGWMRGPFGRLRRFPETLDRKVLDDMKREAQNFLIQNGVADTLSIALYNLVRYRDANRSEGDFRILLQIHDAALLEVPIEHVPWVHDHVLPRCIEGIDVRPLDMDGRDTILRGRPPYHFGIDREVYLNWGEHLTWGEDRNRLIKAGLGPEYLPKEAPPTA